MHCLSNSLNLFNSCFSVPFKTVMATCNVYEAGHVGWKLVFFSYILSYGLPQCIAVYLQLTVEDEKEFITPLMLQKKTKHLERTLLHQEKSNIKLNVTRTHNTFFQLACMCDSLVMKMAWAS